MAAASSVSRHNGNRPLLSTTVDDVERAKRTIEIIRRDDEDGKLYTDTEIHIITLGKSGAGKTSLNGVFTEGESADGDDGPNAGTKELVVPYRFVKEVEGKMVTCNFYDTMGLDDPDFNLQEVKIRLKELVKTHPCIINICVRFDDRCLVDNPTIQTALDICQSLSVDSPSIWENVMISITHSDRLPPKVEAMTDEKYKKEAIDNLATIWRESLRQKLKKFDVSDDSVYICFTSHTKINNNPVDPTWLKTFLWNVLEITTKCCEQLSIGLLLINTKIQEIFAPDINSESINTDDFLTSIEPSPIELPHNGAELVRHTPPVHTTRLPDKRFFQTYQNEIITTLATRGGGICGALAGLGLTKAVGGATVAATTLAAGTGIGLLVGGVACFAIAVGILYFYMKKEKTE